MEKSTKLLKPVLRSNLPVNLSKKAKSMTYVSIVNHLEMYYKDKKVAE